MVKVQSRQRPSSPPAPLQGAPGGSGQLGTPRKWPAHWAPSRCLGYVSQPPPKPPISPPLTMQALRKELAASGGALVVTFADVRGEGAREEVKLQLGEHFFLSSVEAAQAGALVDLD